MRQRSHEQANGSSSVSYGRASLHSGRFPASDRKCPSDRTNAHPPHNHPSTPEPPAPQPDQAADTRSRSGAGHSRTGRGWAPHVPGSGAAAGAGRECPVAGGVAGVIRWGGLCGGQEKSSSIRRPPPPGLTDDTRRASPGVSRPLSGPSIPARRRVRTLGSRPRVEDSLRSTRWRAVSSS